VSWQQQKAAAAQQQQQQQTAMARLQMMLRSMMPGVLLLAVAGLALLRCCRVQLVLAWCWGRGGCGLTTHTTDWRQQVGENVGDGSLSAAAF
jgi:hypothetical protein